jgi:DMSO/TMAO reductase YedYZ molybdopterin-dependent catalytic subunit
MVPSSAEGRGYPSFKERIPQGWRVVHSEAWPINTTFGPEEKLDLNEWRFETYGEVEKEVSLNYDDLSKLNQSTVITDHHCIDGWSYLGHEWSGLDLREIIEHTSPKKSAKYILIECERGLTQAFPLTQDILFATRRNGVPLLRGGGFPLRAVAPGEYGYKSVKWVRRVKFTEKRELDFYEKKLLDWGMEVPPPEENPWNCENGNRKKLLRAVFSRLLDEERTRRIEKANDR